MCTRDAEVVLDVEFDDVGGVHLVLANCGDAVATQIQVRFSRRLDGRGEDPPVSGLPIFRRLGVLRPGRELRVLWDMTQALFPGQGNAPEPFTCTVSWVEQGGQHQQATYEHDLSVFVNLPSPAGLPIGSHAGCAPHHPRTREG